MTQEVEHIESEGEKIDLTGTSGKSKKLKGIKGLIYKGEGKGQQILKIYFDEGFVDSKSYVVASICERSEGDLRETYYFVDKARMTVYNVAPMDNRVDVWINIESDKSLQYCITFLVLNE